MQRRGRIEGDLKFMKDHSLDQLFTTQRVPLAHGDKSKIRELRLGLVEEEEERIWKMEDARMRLEEEVEVTREQAELLKRKAGGAHLCGGERVQGTLEAAAQKKAEGDAARQAAAEERAVREREEEARQKREQEERVRRSID